MPHARPYYLGIFLTSRSRADVRDIARDARGTDAIPFGCKFSGDHVTLAFAPSSADIAAFPLDAFRGAAISLPATVCASGDIADDANAFVIGVDFDDASFRFGLRCASAAPHVSVFIAEHASWSVCGDVLARAVANGSALELSAIGAARELEGTLGIMMVDAGDANVRWIATSMDEVRAATRVDPYGGCASGVRYVKTAARYGDDLCVDLDDSFDDDDEYDDDDENDDDEFYDEFYDERSAPSSSYASAQASRSNSSLNVHDAFRDGAHDQAANQEREYIELCEMFEGQCTEWIHERYVESGCSKEIAAYMIESTLLSQDLNIVPSAKKTPAKREVEAMPETVFELGFRVERMPVASTSRNYGSGVGVGSHFKSDGPAIRGRPAIERAVHQWTSLQGARASSLLAARREANIVVKQSWVDDLNEDMKKLRLLRRKDGGDPELEKRIRDKLSKRVALERIAMSSVMPRFDDDTEFDLVIDFHGYSRRDAVRELERELIRVGPLVTSKWAMKLITGRGIHSSGGPVVHKDIKAWLDQFGLAYEENPDAGHIVVRATAPVFGTRMRR